MRILVPLLALALASAPQATPQRSKLLIDTGSPEGRLLRAISQESDPQKKIALADDFIKQHPQHEGVGWACRQMQDAYASAGQFDQAIEAGQKALAADPADLEAAYGNLKAAEAKKDAGLVIQWSASASGIARKAIATPRGSEEEADEFTRRVEYAKQVDTYGEYALYTTALAETDPQKIIALGKALEERNPESQYLAQLYPRYFNALRQTNDAAGAMAAGEHAFASKQANEDMLLMMADYGMQQKADPDKVVAYATRLIETMSAKPKPEGMSDADWDKKKTQMLGVANWIAGVTYSSQSKWAEADKSLRAALPLIKGGDATMNAMALFHLGVANYNLGKASKSQATMQEALKFSEAAAALESPFKQSALGNVKAIRAEMKKK